MEFDYTVLILSVSTGFDSSESRAAKTTPFKLARGSVMPTTPPTSNVFSNDQTVSTSKRDSNTFRVRVLNMRGSFSTCPLFNRSWKSRLFGCGFSVNRNVSKRKA